MTSLFWCMTLLGSSWRPPSFWPAGGCAFRCRRSPKWSETKTWKRRKRRGARQAGKVLNALQEISQQEYAVCHGQPGYGRLHSRKWTALACISMCDKRGCVSKHTFSTENARRQIGLVGLRAARAGSKLPQGQCMHVARCVLFQNAGWAASEEAWQ